MPNRITQKVSKAERKSCFAHSYEGACRKMCARKKCVRLILLDSMGKMDSSELHTGGM